MVKPTNLAFKKKEYKNFCKRKNKKQNQKQNKTNSIKEREMFSCSDGTLPGHLLGGVLSGGETQLQSVRVWTIWVFHLVMIQEAQSLQGIALGFPLQQPRGAAFTFA